MSLRTTRRIKGLVCLLALLLTAVVFRNTSPATDRTAQDATVLAEQNGQKWYRGNLHTHTHWSDGNHYLDAVAQWYKDHQYDFLCITDHNTIDEIERWVVVEKTKGKLQAFEKLQALFPKDWIEERVVNDQREVRLKTFSEVAARMDEPGKFLMLRGEEISDRFGQRPIHLNVSNIQEAIPPLGGDSVYETMQRNVDAVIAQRERTGQPMIVHLNHPNFHWGVTAEDLMRVRGENFFEVYNGHPGVNNSGDDVHASAEQIWDIINAFRLTDLQLPLMFGLATDDGHDYHRIPSRDSEPGRAWVMVLSESLSPESLIAALEAGRFYATNGVKLERITSDQGRLAVQVVPEDGVTYQIDFVGTNHDFSRESQPVVDKDGKELEATRRYSPDIGKVFKSVAGTQAEYRFNGNELYVRARITSSRLHPNPSVIGDKETAWTQPVPGPAAKTVP